ncbi:competence pheromone ComX [Solibacillus sp. FSL W7-1324]|uniref:competence pheromone ComX n=1 Tax=Solibacillus sp. FSL W7-1324 TaxID=2921701 RepID=UPI0030F557C6
MLKVIRFLQENKEIVELLKQQRLSLIGINKIEQMAIIEAFDDFNNFDEAFREGNGIWS